jgi:hypothetical protein
MTPRFLDLTVPATTRLRETICLRRFVVNPVACIAKNTESQDHLITPCREITFPQPLMDPPREGRPFSAGRTNDLRRGGSATQGQRTTIPGGRVPRQAAATLARLFSAYTRLPGRSFRSAALSAPPHDTLQPTSPSTLHSEVCPMPRFASFQRRTGHCLAATARALQPHVPRRCRRRYCIFRSLAAAI